MNAQQCNPGGPPQLTVVSGPGFREVTQSWTGVSGSNGIYTVHGSPDGGATWGVVQYSVSEGQQVNLTVGVWGYNSPLQTFHTYTFYVSTAICGVPTNSNSISVTTRDFDTPSLSVSTGTEYEKIHQSWVGVAGASILHTVYGSADGGSTWLPIQYSTAPGQQVSFETKYWGYNAPMSTFATYQFYLKVCDGSRCKSSPTVSATTRDIGEPTLSASISPNNKLQLSWNRVEGAMGYTVFTFSTAHNTWNAWNNVGQPGAQTEIVSYEDPWISPFNQISYFYVTANRVNRQRSSNVVSFGAFSDQNFGNPSCGLSVGEPINVSNGNMFINEVDYRLPGLAASINFSRTYNSANQTAGVFGFGWSSLFDEQIQEINQFSLRYQSSDGRALYFGRTNTAQSFKSVTGDFHGWISKGSNNTFLLTNKDGSVRQFGSNGKLIWLEDRNGNRTSISYNANGVLESVIDPFGRTISIISIGGLVYQISDALGNIASYSYFSGTTLLNEVSFSDGSKKRYEYANVGSNTFLRTVRDALDNILETHQYDPSGRAYTSEKHGGTEKYTLDYSNPSYTTVTDGLGRVTKYFFDKSKGRNVLTKTEGNCNCGSGSEITTYEYDNQLNLTKKTDALGRQTIYTYDANGNPLTMTDVWGTSTFTYNSFGQVLTYKDRMNGIWTNTYDANGNLLTTKDALDNITTVEYPATNNKGLPDSIKDARDKITKFKWFASSGLLQEIEDANGKKTNFTYDARGRTKTVTNALNHITTYNYFDDTQRKIELVYPNADKITYKYDIRRLLESMTDERGKITVYEFDSAYRLKKITDPLSHSREFGYDLMSNLIWQKDALGNQTNYIPDNFDRLKEVQYPPAEIGAARLVEKYEY
ncbi:MAG: RHS repeat protein [Pyrinomonadaceae bacterium]|nr:RHS repeat protein [Pyrinomonadaceae bacterium]